ncbi:hypothetical protein ACIRSU_15525 [Streptomyces sp. NPDC101160]|uniref:hypothetical protein n=1 Tax=Streptomyces sp. NPDC101160 TaxID=3366118 RepID=UPI0038307631
MRTLARFAPIALLVPVAATLVLSLGAGTTSTEQTSVTAEGVVTETPQPGDTGDGFSWG